MPMLASADWDSRRGGLDPRSRRRYVQAPTYGPCAAFEMRGGMDEKKSNVPTVTVFGSGSAREGSEAWRQAEQLGAALARRGFALCNGGYGGTMLAAARAAREAGGTTIGVTLSGARWPEANPWVSHEMPCKTLVERIMTLLRTGDAYVALGGGTGTLAEVGLMLDLINKGLLPLKPALFLGQSWMPLLALLKEEPILRRPAVHARFEGVTFVGKIACAESPEVAAAFLAANVTGEETA